MALTVIHFLFANTTVSNDPEGERVTVEQPPPDLYVRQGWNAQDPLSSCHHYLVIFCVILPSIFGIRMCFKCPDCNADGNKVQHEAYACSDYMGCNNTVMGGYAGLATGMLIAT